MHYRVMYGHGHFAEHGRRQALHGDGDAGERRLRRDYPGLAIHARQMVRWYFNRHRHDRPRSPAGRCSPIR
jgi:hypothetical protein